MTGAGRAAAPAAVLLAGCACALWWPATARAQGRLPPTEYEVKAAYIYNFARFAEWPTARGSPGEPLVIAVLGDDPFGAALEQTLASQTVADRPLEVRRVAEPEEAAGARIVFVSASERARLPRVLATLERQGALTVGDLPRFAERGGMIGFRTEERKVRFDINPEAVKRAGVTLSSQLLRLARIVAAERQP